MADVVLGKDYLLTVAISNVYYPFACVQEVGLNVSTEMVNTTTADSGIYRTRIPRLSEWSISLSGVHILRDTTTTKMFALDLITEQVRKTGLDIKLLWTDTGAYTRTIAGHVFISSTDFRGIAGQIGKFNAEFPGSGTLTINGIVTINPSTVNTYDGYAVGNETVITNAILIARTIHWVDLSDSNLQVISTGTPNIRQVKYDSSAGSFTFGRALNALEYYKIMYT